MSSSLAYLISLLGKAGKTENLKIVEDSEPFRHWDENLIIFDNRYANGYTTSKILEVYRKTFYKKNNGHLISVDGDFDELIWTCFIQKISNKNNKKKKILLIIDNLHRNGVVFGGYILNVYNKFFIEKFGNKDFACVFGGEGDIDLEVLSFKSKTNFLERIGFWIIGLFVKGPTLSKVS